MQSPTVRLRTAVWNNRGSDRMYVSRNLMYTGYKSSNGLPHASAGVLPAILRSPDLGGMPPDIPVSRNYLASVGQRSTVMDGNDIRQFR